MALINCPECGKEISSKAASCPNCGCPISVETKPAEEIEQPEFPDLPAVMSVGSQIVNWGFDAAFKGLYFHSENVIKAIPEGEVSVLLHTNGICIHKGLSFFYYISNQQIVNMTITTQEKIITENKSVIGRAVVGGLLLGPLAAVIGGMSGIGTKQKLQGKYYLVINYWDVDSRKLQTILICTKQLLDLFVERYKKEQEKNNVPDGSNCVGNIFNDDLSINENRLAEAVKHISIQDLAQKVQKNTGCTIIEARQKINKIVSSKGVDKSEIKTGGCVVTLLIALSSSLLTLFSIFHLLL